MDPLAHTCTFLSPVAGDGTTNIVTKTIGPGKLLGKTNWSTDFFVTQSYSFYKLFFTANSSVSATYPIQGFLKRRDSSSSAMAPTCRRSTRILPFRWKRAVTGFTWRISVQGCF